MVVWDHEVTNLKATHNKNHDKFVSDLVVWDHKVTNLKATHNRTPWLMPLLRLFEVTKLRIWKQLTTVKWPTRLPNRCLRSQNYEYESNSQLFLGVVYYSFGCLRSQNYEFESNSQPLMKNCFISVCCLRSQSYEFESNSQLGHCFVLLFQVV